MFLMYDYVFIINSINVHYIDVCFQYNQHFFRPLSAVTTATTGTSEVTNRFINILKFYLFPILFSTKMNGKAPQVS